MFIERLTKELLCRFFNVKHINSFMSKSACENGEYLYASYSTDSMVINYRLYDFEGSTVSSETRWRKFLYSIFGEEYIKEYSKWLDEQKELKITELVQ